MSKNSIQIKEKWKKKVTKNKVITFKKKEKNKIDSKKKLKSHNKLRKYKNISPRNCTYIKFKAKDCQNEL